MELDYKAIGKRVKIARIKADLTQERLAEAVGLSNAHMSNIETGTTRVSLTTLVKLANALNVTTDCFLCDNVIAATVPLRCEVAEILEDCDPYELRIVKDIVEAAKSALRRDAKLRDQKQN